MHIEVNPRLWATATVRIDEDRTVARGEVIEIDEDEWEDLRMRRTSQFGSRHQTFIEAGSATPKPEKIYVSLDEISGLTVPELRDVAASHDLGRSGNKTELIERITTALRP